MRAELDELAANTRHVKINQERLRLVAQTLGKEAAAASLQTDPHQNPNQTLLENNRDTMQHYLVATGQYFCIWRRTAGDVEAWDLTIDGQLYTGARGINAALMRALREGQNLLDPHYLAAMTLDDVTRLYRDERDGQTTLQMLPERLAKFNEIGRVLLQFYDGHAANFLAEAGGYLFRDDGRGIVQQLNRRFPTSYFDWPFNKLAILLGKLLMLRLSADVPTTNEFRELASIRDTENFEIAADYYIPLFFIRTGIFEVSRELADHLRNHRLIARDSAMEHDYRAATIVAGRQLAAETGLLIPLVDEESWRNAFFACRVCRVGISDEELPCPYRHLSIAYQERHELMEYRWPLVHTTAY